MQDLTFKRLREANIERAKLYPSKCNMDASFFELAIFGEIGELCNLIKKEYRDGVDYTNKIAKEIADIAIYIDLFSHALNSHSLCYSPSIGSFNKLAKLSIEGGNPSEIEFIIELYKASAGIRFSSQRVETLLIFLGHLARRRKIDLSKAIIDKFNEVSNRINVPIYL